MLLKMHQLRNKVNSLRLNYEFRKRNAKLSKSIDTQKVNHLQITHNCKSVWYGSNYGGFYVNTDLLNQDSIVYSFGIGKDISFDLCCIKRHHCKVFAFDPTPKAIRFIQIEQPPLLFHFFDYGICASPSGMKPFFLPQNPKATSGSLETIGQVNTENVINVEMKRLSDITKELKHQHIDVLKMDIEGSEYEVIEQIMDSSVTIDQILVEFHDRMFDLENSKSKQTVQKMKAKGYEIFAHSNTYEEISFIHKRKLH